MELVAVMVLLLVVLTGLGGGGESDTVMAVGRSDRCCCLGEEMVGEGA